MVEKTERTGLQSIAQPSFLKDVHGNFDHVWFLPYKLTWGLDVLENETLLNKRHRQLAVRKCYGVQRRKEETTAFQQDSMGREKAWHGGWSLSYTGRVNKAKTGGMAQRPFVAEAQRRRETGRDGRTPRLEARLLSPDLPLSSLGQDT